MLNAEVAITDATIRLLPPGVPNTAAYFSLQNSSDKKLTLIGATAGFATKAEIHNHVMVNNMMSMQQQSEVVIESGKKVQFAPGGLHIMLFGLTHPLQAGQSLTISLQTKEGKVIDVIANVARPAAHSHH
ncbi:copper chaperone PCu(A)C [uncultured Paraglaciecola sp.]|uniref:copper chaperone PCu(A)C n=1 Tax=uncultured Paraglaciecola sp. TaxID=1765024 RepID=UPI00260DC177|nr:copper chaperone PCu(A)C [uncultured Paraglaciecola sp.]